VYFVQRKINTFSPVQMMGYFVQKGTKKEALSLSNTDLQSAPFSHSGTYPLAVAAERHLQYLF